MHLSEKEMMMDVGSPKGISKPDMINADMLGVCCPHVDRRAVEMLMGRWVSVFIFAAFNELRRLSVSD